MPLFSMLHFYFFFFTDTATTEIYTLSLHDALPIYVALLRETIFVDEARNLRQILDRIDLGVRVTLDQVFVPQAAPARDRKSTRLNSSHGYISYAVFCLKKKTKKYYKKSK